MRKLRDEVAAFLSSDDGPTAVEYAIVLALIIIVCLTALQSIGTRSSTTFHDGERQTGQRFLALSSGS